MSFVLQSQRIAPTRTPLVAYPLTESALLKGNTQTIKGAK